MRKEVYRSCADLLQLAMVLAQLQDDINYLEQGYTRSADEYQKLVRRAHTVGQEKLKAAAWDCVEYIELLQEAQAFTIQMEGVVDSRAIKRIINSTVLSFNTYIRNVFKKKRVAASHIMVVMVAEETRATKPYALPVLYVPYATIKDQYMRDLLRPVKQAMLNLGMTIAGMLILFNHS